MPMRDSGVCRRVRPHPPERFQHGAVAFTRRGHDDSYLALGVGRFLDREGTSVVVPLARNDVWGDDWMTLLREEIEARGGTVAEPVRYSPDTTDFAPVIGALAARVDEAAETHGSGRPAVYIITLDEIATIHHQTAAYPELSRVRCYGSDLAGLQEYSGTAIDFAVEVNVTYPMYGDAAGWRAVPTLEEIGERIDRTPGPWPCMTVTRSGLPPAPV